MSQDRYTDGEIIAAAVNRIANDVDECATLRDRFAMAALTAMPIGKMPLGLEEHDAVLRRVFCRTLATAAYELADAMVKAREAGK
jgi:hypothetical protein